MSNETQSVETVDVTVGLPKETKALTDGLGKFTEAVSKALDDGFQVGQDIPAIISAALSDLIPAVQHAKKVKEDIKALPVETGYCFGKLGEQIAKAL